MRLLSKLTFLMNTRQSPTAEHVPEHCGISTHEHELKESESENFNRNGRHGVLHTDFHARPEVTIPLHSVHCQPVCRISSADAPLFESRIIGVWIGVWIMVDFPPTTKGGTIRGRLARSVPRRVLELPYEWQACGVLPMSRRQGVWEGAQERVQSLAGRQEDRYKGFC